MSFNKTERQDDSSRSAFCCHCSVIYIRPKGGQKKKSLSYCVLNDDTNDDDDDDDDVGDDDDVVDDDDDDDDDDIMISKTADINKGPAKIKKINK